MRVGAVVCAAIVAALMPAVALADDARARDKETIRQLNLRELARVRERDARYAEGWRAARANAGRQAEYAARSRDHDRALQDYARERARYERAMAQWRRTVAACRAGDYSACDN